MEDVDNQKQTRRSYQRLAETQTQEMEKLFKKCPHPQSKVKQELSNKLGIAPERIQFWFQNRRVQMKAQIERAENANLRAENANLRAESQSLKEALEISKSVCRGELAYKEYMHRLCLENSSLNEANNISATASEHRGKSIQSLEVVKFCPGLEVGSTGKKVMLTTTDILLPSPTSGNPTIRCGAAEGLEKSSQLQTVINATHELIRMADIDKSLLTKRGTKEVLNLEGQVNSFPFKHNNMKREVTRDTSVVMINGAALVEVFMNENKWIDMFPSIVKTSKTLQVHREGLLQLMFAELQFPSPLVSTREAYFLRYCHRLAERVWVVVDLSEKYIYHNVTLHSKRLSGCIIQELRNGYSKVTWVENSGVEDRAVDGMYEHLVKSGMDFGAQRWVATLERQCQRLVSFMATEHGDQGRNIMKLSHRMMNNFCHNISASNIHPSATQWHDSVRITARMSTIPEGVILCSATSLWLPHSPQRLFDFLRDGRMRSKWDVSMEGKEIQEVNHIATGSHPGNCISIFNVKAPNTQMILQESCIDASGSLIVYSAVDIEAINSAMKGGDISSISLLPSGFAIQPDGSLANRPLSENSSLHEATATSSSGLDMQGTGGSLLTAAFQIVGSNFPNANVPPESQKVIINLVCNTVQGIKVALSCSNV